MEYPSMEKQCKFRLYPNKEQEEKIQKNFGCVRFVYNHYLQKRNEAYQSKKENISLTECAKDLTQLKKVPGYEWLAEADDNSLRYALRDLDFAYNAFFQSLNTGDYSAGFPKFKGKRETRQSYRSKNNTIRQSIKLFENKIKLPKLGYVDCKISKNIEGRILFATISQIPSGKYFITVCCTDYEPDDLTKTKCAVGIHMGITTLATLSNGQGYENIRAYKKSKKKITKLTRKLSRKPRGSKNYEKARLKLARAHEKVANQRNDFIHKLTTELVKDHDIICVRDEPFAEKIKTPWFAKHASDTGQSPFVRQLAYKSKWYGKKFIKINRNHPSVQLCNSCGHKNPETKVKQSSSNWTCSACGVQHNRKINAAKNVLDEGMQQLRPDRSDIKPAE